MTNSMHYKVQLKWKLKFHVFKQKAPWTRDCSCNKNTPPVWIIRFTVHLFVFNKIYLTWSILEQPKFEPQNSNLIVQNCKF